MNETIGALSSGVSGLESVHPPGGRERSVVMLVLMGVLVIGFFAILYSRDWQTNRCFRRLFECNQAGGGVDRTPEKSDVRRAPMIKTPQRDKGILK